MYGQGTRFFVYPALFTKLGTTRFFISPDASCIFLTPKDKMLKQLMLLVHMDNVTSSSSSWRIRRRRRKWRRITVGPGTRRGHEYFCSLKAPAIMTRNQRKTVLSFNSDKEGNDSTHSRPSRSESRFCNDIRHHGTCFRITLVYVI